MIRPAGRDDADAVAALLSACDRYALYTPAYVAHDFATTSAVARRAGWGAWEGAELVGYGEAMHAYWSSAAGEAVCRVAVHPGARGRGLGRALYALVDGHLAELDPTRVTCSSDDDAASCRFAERRGFARQGQRTKNGVDPRRLPAPPAPPAGTELVAFADLEPEREALWQLEREAGRDVPSAGPVDFDRLTFEEWREETWDDPDLDLDVSLVARVDGQLASFTTVFSDRSQRRMLTGLTGTAAACRGRGLALLVKRHSLYRAAELGIELALTANHDVNAAMLAVNDKLGYTHLSTTVEWERTA